MAWRLVGFCLSAASFLGKAKKNVEAAKQALLGKVKNIWWPGTCHWSTFVNRNGVFIVEFVCTYYPPKWEIFSTYTVYYINMKLVASE